MSKSVKQIATDVSSESTGFENIGKLVQWFYENDSKKPFSLSCAKVYFYLAKLSFGYVNNIHYEISISTEELMRLTGLSKNTLRKSLKELDDRGMIDRIKWQGFGPKQAYTYRILFPGSGKYVIKTKQKSEKSKIDHMIKEMM